MAVVGLGKTKEQLIGELDERMLAFIGGTRCGVTHAMIKESLDRAILHWRGWMDEKDR